MNGYHKIKIETIGDGIAHGDNTRIFVDGKELTGVLSIKFEVVARELATFQIEMVGNFELDLKAQINTPEKLDLVNGAGVKVGEVVI